MRAGIALGSNVGDRLNNVRLARDQIRALHGGDEPMRCSRVYETEPVGCPPGTAPFLNAVIEIDFYGAPHELFAALRETEKKLGRTERRERNAPRTIDLDVIYFGDLLIETPELTLPHPRAHQRRFVLEPLRDIRPGLVLPGQRKTVAELLKELPPTPMAKVFAGLTDS
jgi:2-amino-4-hydroxy-6-hydroxymethyldihydropteridine diphosphokinase